MIQDSGDDGDLDGGQGVCGSDEEQCPSDCEHRQGLLVEAGDSDEVEHVVGADAGDLPDCSDGIGGARVDGVGGPKRRDFPSF